MIELDELRKYGHECCARIDDAIEEHVARIEQAIADRYMELPLDADGVPWHIGDAVDGHGTVQSMGLNCYGWHFVGVENAIDPAIHRHVKPDTIEDVLADFAAEVENGNNTYETARRYAERIERMVRDDR